jgi:hypothetical protein
MHIAFDLLQVFTLTNLRSKLRLARIWVSGDPGFSDHIVIITGSQLERKLIQLIGSARWSTAGLFRSTQGRLTSLFHLSTPGSLSVMDATAPAMSPGDFRLSTHEASENVNLKIGQSEQDLVVVPVVVATWLPIQRFNDSTLLVSAVSLRLSAPLRPSDSCDLN